MSELSEKLEIVKRSVGDRAIRRLHPRCKNLSGRGQRERCDGIECEWRFEILESDAAGPILVTYVSMDQRKYWKRVAISEKTIIMEHLWEREELVDATK